jgi:hypothetical protein
MVAEPRSGARLKERWQETMGALGARREKDARCKIRKNIDFGWRWSGREMVDVGVYCAGAARVA